ncbi:MAG: hypothetical protein ACREO8_08735 [Luteimonas sp.]
MNGAMRSLEQNNDEPGDGLRNWASLLALTALAGCVSSPESALRINPAQVPFTPQAKLTAPKELSWQLHRTSVSPVTRRSTIAIPAIGAAPAQSFSFDTTLPHAALFGYSDQKTSLNLLKSALAASGFAEHAQAACQAILSFDKADFKSTWGYQYLVDASISVRADERVLWSKRYHLDSAQAQSHWKTMTDSYRDGKQKVAQQLLAAATADLVAWGQTSQPMCQAGENRRPAAEVEAFAPDPRIQGQLKIVSATDLPKVKPDCSAKNVFSCQNPEYQALVAKPLGLAAARQAVAGKTTRSFLAAHATQVSYAAADGRIYLWTPQAIPRCCKASGASLAWPRCSHR